MATANVSQNSSQKPRDLIARIVLTVAALGTVFAFVGAIGSVQSATPAAVVAEVWHMYGLLVFAGLFTLLAVGLRRLTGVWELVIFHKAAIRTLGFASTLISHRDHGRISHLGRTKTDQQIGHRRF